MKTSLFLAALLPLLLAAPAAADSLILDHPTTTTINGLAATSVGDLAVENSSLRVWISSGSSNGLVYKLDFASGTALATVDPSVIPGLNSGPDALAIVPASGGGNLVVFSSFGESEGGRITQAGALVTDYNTSQNATGADFDSAGNLWIASGIVANGGSVLKRLDLATGAVLQSVPIVGTTSRIVDLAFDPNTGACYCLLEATPTLIEVSLTTGAIVSTTDLSAFLSYTNNVAGGFDFRPDGATLYFAIGQALSTSATIISVTREFDRTVCDGAGPVACPCGNAGLPGRGCANSAVAGGTLLDGINAASVNLDSFILLANGLPPTSTCLFFQGTTNPTATVFGDGLRCVAGSIIRLGLATASSGDAHYPGTGDPDISVRGLIPAAGGQRYYQAWYRNAASFCTTSTFNVSNAIAVHWGP
jgi:hypothetical protein